jgi:hypothetical protein
MGLLPIIAPIADAFEMASPMKIASALHRFDAQPESRF